jgi:uncharacterized membrane protein YdfJ with MMPL/SSD domain
MTDRTGTGLLARLVLRHRRHVVAGWLVLLVAGAAGAGILLDATLVRTLLLLALVGLFGRRNWWLPRPPA